MFQSLIMIVEQLKYINVVNLHEDNFELLHETQFLLNLV
jgi:hypothetical protein